MSFTGEIKRELLRSSPTERGEMLALLCGALDTGGDRLFSNGEPFGFSFTSENEKSAEYLLRLVELCFGVRMTVTEAVRDPKHGRDKLTFSLLGERSGKLAEEIDLHNAEHAFSEEGQAYLKGAFLCGGSCTLPREGARTGYHLEVVFPLQEYAERFCELLEGFQLLGSALRRGERSVVYLKSREGIADFLSVIGASGALEKLESVTAAREENNNRNRVENCTAGNADRAAIASAALIVAIGEMKKDGTLDTLPAPLREAAQARLLEPTLTLAELAERLSITKSCLNHRLRKLMTYRTKE